MIWAGIIWAGLLSAGPALAAPPDVRVGDVVIDPAGKPVGTIQSTRDGEAVVWTGTMKVTLGLSSFRMTRSGLRIGMSRAELEAAATWVQAKGDEEIRAKLTPGTQVRGSDGAPLATVESIEADMVILAAGTAKVRFPISAFKSDRNGVRIGMTIAELAGFIKAQAPPPPPAPTEDTKRGEPVKDASTEE